MVLACFSTAICQQPAMAVLAGWRPAVTATGIRLAALAACFQAYFQQLPYSPLVPSTQFARLELLRTTHLHHCKHGVHTK